jgi:hypothetical protein
MLRLYNFISMKSVLTLTLLTLLITPLFPNSVLAASQVALPKISPNGGSILTRSTITISSATTGATIHYTINGSTPTTSSYKYSGSVDLQPNNTALKVGTYTVKAIAVKSGFVNSPIAQASFNVSNKDQASRNTLLANRISVNKNDCWTSTKTNCTSLLNMRSATVNEIIYFAKACDKWNAPTGSYANRCGVIVTGGTEAGHSGSGSCSHAGGYKFDMGITTLIGNYIANKSYFSYLGIRSDGAPMYKWLSGGAIYARESNPDHWDVLVGC